MDRSRFSISSWSFLAAWDTNSGGEIEKAARDVFYTIEKQEYNRTPRRVFIPTGMFLKEMLGR
jgi:hypothetical protein